MGSLISKFISNPSRTLIESQTFPFPKTSSYDINHEHFLYIKSLQCSVPCMFYTNSQSKFIIIYSHGNATDIGLTNNLLKKLSILLNTNIITYDYVGYGLSSGKPSEFGCIQSMNIVFDYVVNQGYLQQNIILYGVSIGTGPSVDIASRIKNIKGLLLQSPYTSIVGVVSESTELLSFSVCSQDRNPNIFRNLEKIDLVVAPIIILHGTHDSLINISHAEKLCAKNLFHTKLIKVPFAGHNDIEQNHFDLILKCLNELINFN